MFGSLSVSKAIGRLCGAVIAGIVLTGACRGAPVVEPTPAEMKHKVQEYSKAIANSPENVDLLIQRGDAYFALHEFDKATDDYTAALALDDTVDKAYLGRGLALGRAGWIEDGISDLTVFLERNPESSYGYTKRGVRYLWLGDRANAEKDLRTAVALDPGNAEAHDDLGVVLAQQQKYAEAASHFSETIGLDPTYQKAYHNLAMVYYIAGQDVLALNAVENALRLSPQARNSLLLQAEILMALGRHGEALAIKEEAEFLPEGNWSERAPVQ